VHISHIANTIIAFVLCLIAASDVLSLSDSSSQERTIDGGQKVPVQIIENWSEINGVVLSAEPSTDVHDFMAVTVAVDHVTALDGFANLLTDVAGKQIVMLVPQELFSALDVKQGSVITCWVRKAGLNRIFVHRQHISVRPPVQ
jgi:hypothetical protein